MLKVFNTLSGQKEEFIPQQPGQVKMYVCGVTVYDDCHIGHGRAYVSFDIIRRWLEARGNQVTYVQNFTDIDDKIIKRAAEVGQSPAELAARYTAAYFEVADKLNIKRADHYPKATEFVPQMIEFIRTLVEKGFAYQVAGDVYFSVKKLPDYGKLSGRDLEKMTAGVRVEVSEQKNDPLDFALWKAAKEGEPFWDSPWGRGRPGWHIECSVMSMKYLGRTLDIHGGGADLIFPHHENEIAQSEALTGQPFVKYWLHNGFINIDRTKMSKSLGNILTLKEIFQKYEPLVLRFYLLQTHYRSPIDFSFDALAEAQKGWKRLDNTRRKMDQLLARAGWRDPGGPYDDFVAEFQKEFEQAMDDDFNTARALAILFDLVRETNRLAEDYEVSQDKENLVILGQAKRLLGEMTEALGLAVQAAAADEVPAQVQELVAAREQARRGKDWARSDALRAELDKLGYLVEDAKQGPRLIRKEK